MKAAISVGSSGTTTERSTIWSSTTTPMRVRACVENVASFMAVATVEQRPYCYRVLMLARSQGAVESNLADFDQMLKSVRFSSRSAPAGSPVPTVAPGSG